MASTKSSTSRRKLYTIRRKQTPRYIEKPYNYMYGIEQEDDTLRKYVLGSIVPVKKRRRFQRKKTGTQPDLLERLRTVSLPGLDRVLDSRLGIVGKIFWVLIICCLFVMCFYQLGQRVKVFLDQPISEHVAVEAGSDLAFPAVTICPVEPFLFSKDFNELRNRYSMKFKNTTFSPENTNELEDPEIDALDLLLLPDVTANTIWELAHLSNATHVRKQKILCQLHSKKNCHLKLLVEELVTYSGTCLTFYLSGNLTYDGTYNGIELELHNYENNIDWHFMAFLHEAGHLSKHDIYSRSQEFLYPQQETHITFNMKQIICANTRSNPCAEGHEAHECHQECVEENILANITCTLPYLTVPYLELCTTPEEAKHTYAVTEHVYEHERSLCRHCHRQCEEIVYIMTQDVVKPTTQNQTKLTVMMTNNFIEQITEETPYSFGLLLGDIGGNLGFFMGMCIVSWLQLVEVIIFEIYPRLKVSLIKLYSRIHAAKHD